MAYRGMAVWPFGQAAGAISVGTGWVIGLIPFLIPVSISPASQRPGKTIFGPSTARSNPSSAKRARAASRPCTPCRSRICS